MKYIHRYWNLSIYPFASLDWFQSGCWLCVSCCVDTDLQWIRLKPFRKQFHYPSFHMEISLSEIIRFICHFSRKMSFQKHPFLASSTIHLFYRSIFEWNLCHVCRISDSRHQWFKSLHFYSLSLSLSSLHSFSLLFVEPSTISILTKTTPSYTFFHNLIDSRTP